MARIVSVTLPSGIEATLRNLKVSEENILASSKAQRDPTTWDRVLEACILSVDNVPGWYKGALKADGSVDAAGLFVGDRFAILYYLRRLTYGDIMDFEWGCKNCSAVVPWSCDLSLLPVKAFPEETLRVLAEQGGVFQDVLPDGGLHVSYRLLTGRDEARIAKIRKGANEEALSSTLLKARLIELDGRLPTKAELEDLSAGDADWLRQEWERVDGGVDSEIEVLCPECREGSRRDLPFGPKFFKRPKTLRLTLGQTSA